MSETGFNIKYVHVSTEMELDVMKRIIATLPRADRHKLYRDDEFRLNKIKEYWTNVHGITNC